MSPIGAWLIFSVILIFSKKDSEKKLGRGESMRIDRKSVAEVFLLASTIGISILLASSMPVKAYLDPDLTNDGVIDMRDIVIAARSFGTRPGDTLWRPEADFNQDNIINIEDLTFVAKYFGRLYAPVLGSITPETITVTLQPGESTNETLEVTFSCTFDFNLGNLELKTSEGYETWLTSVTPPEHTEVWTNKGPYPFQITITVPSGTVPGNYSFQINAYTFGGEPMGEASQDVTVEVTPKLTVPEVPLGTILTLTSMIIALALYIALPKLKRKLGPLTPSPPN
jgi:hypothetical protein